MIRSFFAGLAKIVSEFLQQPLRVFALSLAVMAVGLLLDGSLFRLWRLDRDSKSIVARMDTLRAQNRDLDQKIKKAKDPSFIEMEARERFDLASEGDLVFVFSDDE